MDQGSFDRIAKVLGGAVSRRAGLIAMLGMALAPAAEATRPGKDAAKKGDRGRKPGVEGPCGDGSRKDNACTKDKQCCTGYCKKPLNNRDGQGRCRCIRSGQECKSSQTCCHGTCANGVCGGSGPGPEPKPIPTGEACTVADRCADANAACVAYDSGSPAGTYCLLQTGEACAAANDCQTQICTSGTCAPVTVPTGEACTQADTCADAGASCVAYDTAFPTGTYCLLAKSASCTGDAECVTGLCSGTCVSCTVCASGCDYTTITGAWNAASAGAVIDIAPGEYTGDVLTIDKSVTFQRCGVGGSVTWKIADLSRALTMDKQAGTLTLKHLDFRAVGSNPNGVALVVGDRSSIYPTLVADYITIEGVVTNDESPIAVRGGSSATITNSTFTNNNGYEPGGAIMFNSSDISGATLTLTDCTFTGNYSDDSYGGGAVKVTGASAALSVTGCTFTGNDADTYGGAITVGGEGTTATIADCTFTTNTAKNGGGGLFIDHVNTTVTVTVTNSTFTGNTVQTQGGGGVYAGAGAVLTLDGCTLTGNQTQQTDADRRSGGGAIFGYPNSTITVKDTEISGNTAKTTGGGIAVDAYTSPNFATLTLTGTTTVTGNSVTDGASGHGSGIAGIRDTTGGTGGVLTITGADTRTSGNTTPPVECEISTNSGVSWSTAAGCVF